MAKSCRTCKFFGKAPDRRYSRNGVHPCTAPMPELRIPESVLPPWRLKALDEGRNYVGGEQGKECPAYEKAR